MYSPTGNKYPALNKIQAGRSTSADISQDAIGRRMLRADLPKRNVGDLRPSRKGGSPLARGPESFIPALMEAAKRLGVSPSYATRPEVLAKIKQVPNTSGGMFGMTKPEYRRYSPETQGKQSPYPDIQATAGLRRLLATGGV